MTFERNSRKQASSRSTPSTRTASSSPLRSSATQPGPRRRIRSTRRRRRSAVMRTEAPAISPSWIAVATARSPDERDGEAEQRHVDGPAIENAADRERDGDARRDACSGDDQAEAHGGGERPRLRHREPHEPSVERARRRGSRRGAHGIAVRIMQGWYGSVTGPDLVIVGPSSRPGYSRSLTSTIARHGWPSPFGTRLGRSRRPAAAPCSRSIGSAWTFGHGPASITPYLELRAAARCS